MLGQRGDGDVAAAFQCRKAKRRGPGVVDEADSAFLARDPRQSRDVAHFHGKTAGHLEHDRAGPVAEGSLIGFEIERIEEAMLDAEPLEQARGDAARRIVGIVGDQQDIAATQHGQQRGRQGGKPAGIEHGARSPWFERGQRLAQRPLGGRPAATVEELPVAVVRLAFAQIGAAGIEMRARAPDGRIDHRFGKGARASAGHQTGIASEGWIVLAGHCYPAIPRCLGVSGSLLHSSQLPS